MSDSDGLKMGYSGQRKGGTVTVLGGFVEWMGAMATIGHVQL